MSCVSGVWKTFRDLWTANNLNRRRSCVTFGSRGVNRRANGEGEETTTAEEEVEEEGGVIASIIVY